MATIDQNETVTAPKPQTKPLEFRRAYENYKKLTQSPDDTEYVFEIIDALSTGTKTRDYDMMRRRPSGKRMLKEQPDLVAALSDPRLKDLPEGTLGRTYYEFMAEEGLTADGLIKASEIDRSIERELNDEQEWFSGRIRDQHDLWHVVAGYGRDPLGELSLLGFSYAQTRTLGFAFIAVMGSIFARKNHPEVPVAKAVWQGFLNGQRAKWLTATPWEEMLDMPLEDVRRFLRVNKPTVYNEILSIPDMNFEPSAA
ncbi:MAG: Coq4 family protein [Alphaproteobacteria bacterium]